MLNNGGEQSLMEKQCKSTNARPEIRYPHGLARLRFRRSSYRSDQELT